MSKLSQIIAENELSSLLTKNYMGLELEEHRLLKDGRISRYPYPAEFLSRRHNPYLKTDFADNMLEISGTPTLGTDANLANLAMLQQLVTDHLQADEIIWPLSIAPAFSKDDLDFAVHSTLAFGWLNITTIYSKNTARLEKSLPASISTTASIKRWCNHCGTTVLMKTSPRWPTLRML